MGYYTEYELEIVDSEDISPIFNYVRENGEYALTKFGETYNAVKWYEHENNMRELSLKHPKLLFKLSGKGEDSGDIWVKYFFNGLMQECKGKLVIPPFNPNLFK